MLIKVYWCMNAIRIRAVFIAVYVYIGNEGQTRQMMSAECRFCLFSVSAEIPFGFDNPASGTNGVTAAKLFLP